MSIQLNCQQLLRIYQYLPCPMCLVFYYSLLQCSHGTISMPWFLHTAIIANTHPKWQIEIFRPLGRKRHSKRTFVQLCGLYMEAILPLTAQDVRFTLQAMLLPNIPNHKETLMKDRMYLPLAYL